MSTTIIKDLKNVFMGNVGAKAKSQSLGSESFSQVFDKTQGSRADSGSVEVRSNKADRADDVQKYLNTRNNKTSDKFQEKINELEKTLEQERLQQAAEEAGSAMVEKTAQTFDVTVEEVENVLASMGLNPIDLLNSENLTQVVLALNPQLDALSIVTDEMIYADLKDLMNLAEELTNQLKSQFNLASEEMNQYLESMELAGEVDQEGFTLVTDDTDGEALNVKEGLGDRAAVTVEASADTSLAASTAMKRDSNRGDASANQGDTDHMAKQTFIKNLMDNMAEAVNKIQGNQGIYGTSGQDIIQQITDYIKVNVKAETTELELQLHPASLGNVKVQIASTEGVLTATFTTQNEAVKAALEAQLIQLKDNFEQQGLKVESIEVNVATQGFERSLEQEQQERNSFEEQSKKGRRIRLSGIESLEDLSLEELEEEDKVVADMMLRNGNSVDYTV